MAPIFGRPRTEALPTLEPLGEIPGRQSPEVAAAAAAEKQRRLQARGRSSTILGGATGTPGNIGRKTLLGG